MSKLKDEMGKAQPRKLSRNAAQTLEKCPWVTVNSRGNVVFDPSPAFDIIDPDNDSWHVAVCLPKGWRDYPEDTQHIIANEVLKARHVYRRNLIAARPSRRRHIPDPKEGDLVGAPARLEACRRILNGPDTPGRRYLQGLGHTPTDEDLIPF